MLKYVRPLIVSLTVVALMGLVAFGQEVSKPLSLSRDTTVGAQKLARGGYTIKFVDDKDGQIAFLKGNRELARANYRLVKLSRPAADSSVIFSVSTDGSYKLNRIEFKGETFAVEIE
jgi:hypothetical protein